MKSNILLKSLLSLTLALSLSACSKPYSLSNLPKTTAVPYQLQLEFSSALDDLYYVFSGPALTYSRFPVNTRLSALFREQTQQQSSPSAPSRAVLKIHIEQLKTEFDEIGQNRPAEPVLVATLGDGRAFLAGDFNQGGDFPLPRITRKTARMTLLLQLERAGQTLEEKRVEIEHTESHNWYEEDGSFVDYYRYSYKPVLDGIYRKALVEVGTFVEQTLGN